MVAKILEAHDANDPFAFRAAYCEVGEIPAWSGNEMKKGIKSLYFAALRAHLSGGRAPGSWRALFDRRGVQLIARIQFALAGVMKVADNSNNEPTACNVFMVYS